MARSKKAEPVEEVKSNRAVYSYIKDPELFRSKCHSYFEMCVMKGQFPSFSGLRLHCGITVSELDLMVTGKTSDEIQLILEETKDLRDDCLMQLMADNPKLAPSCMSLRKEDWNDGVADNKLTVVLKVEGLSDPRNFVIK